MTASAAAAWCPVAAESALAPVPVRVRESAPAPVLAQEQVPAPVQVPVPERVQVPVPERVPERVPARAQVRLQPEGSKNHLLRRRIPSARLLTTT